VVPMIASSTAYRPEGSDLKWTKEGPQRALRMMTLPPTLIESEPLVDVEVWLTEEMRQIALGPSYALGFHEGSGELAVWELEHQ